MKVEPERVDKIEKRHKDAFKQVEEWMSSSYLTREIVMEKLKLPENTSSLIIIPSNGKGSGFLRNAYDSFYCAGYIEQSEFIEIIGKLAYVYKPFSV